MWSTGTLSCPQTGGKYEYCVKRYGDLSEAYGIDGGRVRRLTIRKVGKSRALCHYNRGWDIKPRDEIKAVYAIILQKYN